MKLNSLYREHETSEATLILGIMGSFCLDTLIISILINGLFCSPISIHTDGEHEGDFLDNIFRNIRSFIEDVDFDDTQQNKTMPETMFQINKIIELPGGVQKIEKFVQNESEGDDIKRSSDEIEEYTKFPNHTIFHGNREEIECVDTMDCNTTCYCEKLSYTCQSCHSTSESCHSSEECCAGLVCANNICKGLKGISGDKCSAATDCDEQFCCVLGDDGDGVCQPYLKEGENCGKDPFTDMFDNSFVQEAVTGLPNRCPCGRRLQCQKHQTFLFVTSEVCTRVKPKRNEKRKKSRKSKRRRTPSYHYHTLKDEKKLPIPDLYGSDEKLDSTATSTTKKTKLNLFSGFNKNKEDESDNDDEKIKEDNKRDVEEMSERARNAIHDFIDGLFDNLVKGVIKR